MDKNGGRKDGLALAMGWFSIGLGLAQVIAPGRVARLIGMSDGDMSRSLMRLAGARELVCGVGLLTRSRPVGWLWARVAGDVKDLTCLSIAMKMGAREPNRVMAAMAAVVGALLLDLRGARRLSRHTNVIEVRQAITITRPPNEVYRYWRDFQNLPRFMNHVEAVRVMGGRRSHWTVTAPGGRKVEWDAEIVEDRPNELIAWRSLEGADVPNSGSVRFTPAPGGRGVEVRVELRYHPPGGALGSAIATLFGEEPSQQAWDDLRALKQVLEAGEVVLSDASLHGRPHPARPPAADEISA